MDTIYYFDRIRISTFEDPNFLKAQLPMETLKENSEHFQIDRINHNKQFTGYKSRIDLTAPTPECLKVLYDNQHAIGPYKISAIEITKDQITTSEYEAINLSNAQLQSLRKKYSSKNFIYSQFKNGTFLDPKKDPKKFGHSTGYFGTKNFQYVVYPRISKIIDQPSIHSEFRIKGPSKIREKTGISEIGHLLGFNFQKWFKDHENRFLENAHINQHALGKWLRNETRKRAYTNRQLYSVGLTAAQFCHYNGIGGYASLHDYFIQQKSELRNKLRSQRGPKTEDQQRLLNLRISRFKTLTNVSTRSTTLETCL